MAFNFLKSCYYFFEFRFLEVESSGRRDEIRLHYIHNDRSHTEVFPYHLADNQWHKLALSFVDNFVQLYIDCVKVYERQIKDIDLGFVHRRDVQLWLGQRNSRHAYFKVILLNCFQVQIWNRKSHIFMQHSISVLNNSAVDWCHFWRWKNTQNRTKQNCLFSNPWALILQLSEVHGCGDWFMCEPYFAISPAIESAWFS